MIKPCMKLTSGLTFIFMISIIGLSLQVWTVYNQSMYVVTRQTQNVLGKTYELEYHTEVVKKASGLEFLTGNWRQDAAIFPTEKVSNRTLTIGIPTIQRENATYIFDTLDSLFNCATEEELKKIYIVIFLADFNNQWKENMTRELGFKYSSHIESGVLQVIKAPPQFYPPLTDPELSHTYAFHSMKKRKWRAKQNFDYAYLFMYSKPLSPFYLQLEDDVYTVSGYISRIIHHLHKQDKWVCLEFSELGYVGKAYHSEDLERLTKMILLFYVEQPGDFTYLHFNSMMLQFRRKIIYPTLFQHLGLKSSLPGKIQKLKDLNFAGKVYIGDNPPAKLFTTIKRIYSDHSLANAYGSGEGTFWSKQNPEVNDTITILFEEPQRVDQVVIVTGSGEYPTDKLEEGELWACVNKTEDNNTEPICSDYVSLGTFKNGLIKASNLDTKLSNKKVLYLHIVVTKSQKYWLIIREIAVFTTNISERKEQDNT